MADQNDAGLLRSIDRGVIVVENAFNAIASTFIFIMMCFLCAEVVGRRVFNAPIPGAIDWVEVWMATFAFLGVAYCQRNGGHVRMELVISRLRGRLIWIAEAFAVSVAIVYIVIIGWQSFEHFLRAYHLGDSTIDIQLDLWPSKLVVPFALGLLTIRLLLNLWGYIRLIANPDAERVAIPPVQAEIQEAREEIELTVGRDRDAENRPEDRQS